MGINSPESYLKNRNTYVVGTITFEHATNSSAVHTSAATCNVKNFVDNAIIVHTFAATEHDHSFFLLPKQ